MARWLNEIFRPSLKCARLGHKPKERRYRVYVRPDGTTFRSVMDRAVMVTCGCARCGAKLKEPVFEHRYGIQNFSAPSNIYDEIRERGFYVSGSLD